MALTSRLEVEIDSRDAEQKAKDLRDALGELETSGNLIDPSLKKASKSMDGLGKSSKGATESVKGQADEIGDLLGRINPLIKKLDELDKQEQELVKHRKAGKIDTDTFNEYQAKITSTRAELARFNESIGKTGVSAKQTAAALRGVPAQFTDIATSLQGGQAPLTVFLQQGGQLKDMFGGIGPAAKALGGYVLGLVNPFTVAAAAAAGLGIAYYQGSKEADAYRNALINTGNSAGTTAGALSSMASSIGGTVGTTGEAAAALALLAENGKIARGSFEEIATAAVASQEATGKAVSETIAEFAKIAEDPVKAAKTLNDQYNFLTTSVYNQIVALKEQGRETEAARILTDSYADAVRSRATQVTTNLGSIERAWAAISLETRKTIDSVLNVGRLEDTAKKITDLTQKVAAAQSALKADPKDLDNQKKLTNSKMELDFLVQQRDTQAAIAAAEALSAENQRKGIAATAEFNAQLKSGANNAEKRAEAIKVLNKQIADAVKADAPLADKDIARRIADINEQFKDPAVKKELEYREDAGQKMLDNARQQYAVLQQQGMLIGQQGEGTKALGAEAKKLLELEQQIAQLKEKGSLTTAQKQILVMADLNIAQQKQNAWLEKENELRKIANAEAAKLLTFTESINDKLALSQQGLSNQLAGIGLGQEGRKRLQDDLKIRQDYQKDMDKLQAQFNSGDLSKELYEKETAMLEDALDQRLSMQQDYYTQLEKAQSDWTNGASAAWQDYVDEANDIAGQTYSAFRNAFDGLEDSLTSFVTGGKLSFKSLADSIIADLARIAAKTLIVQPLLSSLTSGGGGVLNGLLGSSGSSGGGSSSTLGVLDAAGKSISLATSGFGQAVAAGYTAGEGLIGGIQGAFSSGAGYISNSITSAFATGSSTAASVIAQSAATNTGYQIGGTLVSGEIGSATYATSAASSGISSANVVTAAIAGFIQGYKANGVKGGVAAAGGAVGGMYAGAQVGSYFGPIGTAVGAVIGTIVGAAFGSSIFAGEWQTKDQGIQLGVQGGMLQSANYEFQKKKGGLFHSNKKRTNLTALDPGLQKALDDSYNGTLGTVLGLFDALNVELNDGVLDGLNVATKQISTKGKTSDKIQAELTAWFSDLGNAAIGAVDSAFGGLGLAGRTVESLTAFVNGLFSVNNVLANLNVGIFDASVSGAFAAEQLAKMAGGLDKFTEASAAYYDKFFTDGEKASDVLKAVGVQFAAVGVGLPASRQGFRDLVEAIDITTESGRNMYSVLIGLSGNAAAAYDILEQRTSAGSSSAMAAVQRAIDAQKTSINDMLQTAQGNVSDLTSVSNDLSSALKALRGDSDSAVKMLRAQAVATLQSALATARSGKSLSGFDGLSDALNTVSSNNTDLYSTLEDFNRDQGRSAALIDELNTLNGKQLTNAEKTVKALQDQLDRLDDQLALAQAQIDALNGVDNSVMGVTAAVNAMNAAVVAALAGMGGKGATNSAATNGVFIDSVYKDVLGLQGADAAGKNYWLGELANGHITLGQLAQAIANAAKERKQDVKAGYATGGLISGPGTGTSDSIVARLSNGEYVLTADAVRNYGTGLLDQMNAGQLPAFAAGGGIRLVSNSAPVAAAGSRYNGASGSVAGMAMSGNQQGVIDAINGLQNYLYMITKYSEQTASGVRRQNEMQEAA